MEVWTCLTPDRPLRHSHSIGADASIGEALEKMTELGVARLAVMVNGTRMGVVWRSDLEICQARSKLEAEIQTLRTLTAP